MNSETTTPAFTITNLNTGETTPIMEDTFSALNAADVPPSVQGSLGYGARWATWYENGAGWYDEGTSYRIDRN